MLVYIVMGTTGEYSDRGEWPVYAFKTKDEAKDYINQLNLQYQQIDKSNRWERRKEIKQAMSLDPNF